jgi:hypothetical protein
VLFGPHLQNAAAEGCIYLKARLFGSIWSLLAARIGLPMKRLGLVLSGAMLLGAVAPAIPAVGQDRYYNGSRGTRMYDDRYDRRHYDNRQGGIGPGKGALIGGGAGALLGGLLGGGLKGALIGGGIGAGGGALLGKANQDSKRNRDYRDYGYRR